MRTPESDTIYLRTVVSTFIKLILADEDMEGLIIFPTDL